MKYRDFYIFNFFRQKGAVEATDIETCNQILQRVTVLLHTINNKMST